MFYYEKAKEQGWKPPTFTLKCKVLNSNIQFQCDYSYIDLIDKLMELFKWNISTKIQIIQHYENNVVDVTIKCIVKIMEMKKCQN